MCLGCNPRRPATGRVHAGSVMAQQAGPAALHIGGEML
jgi:hypothetical protein